MKRFTLVVTSKLCGLAHWHHSHRSCRATNSLFRICRQNKDSIDLHLGPNIWSLGSHAQKICLTNIQDELSGLIRTAEDGVR